MSLRAVGGALRVRVCGLLGGGHGPLVPAPAPALAGCEARRHYAMRLELTENGIIWRRPEYIPSWKPEKSGDLRQYEEPVESRPQVKVMAAKEAWERADEVTKQLLSLKFGNAWERRRVARHDCMREIQRHQYDNSSMEVKIAMLTVTIRSLQQTLPKKQAKKSIRLRVRLQETIDRRKKLLKHLRRMDYKRFEWLIEQLGILYRPPPRVHRWVTRKESLQKLVEMHGLELREQRMEAYRAQLEAQKGPFLEEKAKTLCWIAETEKKLGLPVTVEVPKAPAAPPAPPPEGTTAPATP